MAYLNWRAEGDNQDGDTPSEHTGGVSPIGTFFIVLFVLLVVGALGWVAFTQLRARRLGLPAPSWTSYIPFVSSSSSAYSGPAPAPGGIRGWFSDKWSALRGGRGGSGSGGRSAPGAYERRGFGPLDPDEAWDTRVGHEADGPYGYSGSGYGLGGAQELGTTSRAYYGGDDDDDDHGFPERGRPRSRSPGRSGAGMGANLGGRNPFDDDAEPSNVSMRGVSPRPIDTTVAAQKSGGRGGSPTSERRSIFRENV